ncbi:MAG: hypothetical protein ACREPR_12450 [Brasilonema sp.]
MSIATLTKKLSKTFKTVTLSNFLLLIIVIEAVHFANLMLTLPLHTAYLQIPTTIREVVFLCKSKGGRFLFGIGFALELDALAQVLSIFSSIWSQLAILFFANFNQLKPIIEKKMANYQVF